jgi:molybdate transport system substrate-binding protein
MLNYAIYNMQIFWYGEGMMKRRAWASLLTSLAILVSPLAAGAQEGIRAAVAMNYLVAFNDVSLAFEKKTGVKVEATFTSTGSLYAQIVNGAPYDLFLSADEERPALLHKDGLAEKPFVYARGQCVLWSARKGFCRAKDWREAIKAETVKRIAIANPETAPYGTAAKTALRKAGLWEPLQKKWITAQDIAQAFQYASTEATDAGFCALSSVLSDEGKKGCYYPVEEAPRIVQTACILKKTGQRESVKRFAAFLLSPEAAAIKVRAGYR